MYALGIIYFLSCHQKVSNLLKIQSTWAIFETIKNPGQTHNCSIHMSYKTADAQDIARNPIFE